MRGRAFRRRILFAVAALLLVPASFVGWGQYTHNFGTVRQGEVYRSGQMPAEALTDTIVANRVKTVLNLRGDNPDQSWYRAERQAVLDSGITLVDVPMSSSEWMSRAQLRAVVNVLDTYERPILVHCQFGTDRTGLVSTIAELLRPGTTVDDSRRQLSVRYLYVRAGARKVMAEHVDAYESWLNGQHLKHAPEAFRRWVVEGYVPKKPSREFWPYDPKPAFVVTRPKEKTAIR